MPNRDFSLPKEDIRAQEMVFWLKKLSLDIPNLVKPEVDLSPISLTLEENSRKTQLLEEQNRQMLQGMERLDRRLDECFDLLRDVTGHLSRLADLPASATSPYESERPFESPSSSNHAHTQTYDASSGPLSIDVQGRSHAIPRTRSKRCISVQQTENIDDVAGVVDVPRLRIPSLRYAFSEDGNSEEIIETQSDCLTALNRVPRAAGTTRPYSSMLDRQAGSLLSAESAVVSKKRSRRQLIVAPMLQAGVQDSQIQHSAEL